MELVSLQNLLHELIRQRKRNNEQAAKPEDVEDINAGIQQAINIARKTTLQTKECPRCQLQIPEIFNYCYECGSELYEGEL